MSPILVFLIVPLVTSFAFIPTSRRSHNCDFITRQGIKYDKEAWETGFSTSSGEVCEPLANDSLPKDLRGTYYRNGHAKFEVGEHKIIHPFDADGMITAIDIQDGKALFRNRFVRTDIFKKERRRKRILARGAFGTPKTGGLLANIFDLRTRDVANTNVLYWGGRLLALFESTNPHTIEPDSLRTITKTTLKGQLKQNQPFSAHPKVDSNTGRLVSFSSQPRGTSKTSMTVFEFNSTFDIVRQRTVDIPGFVFFHDFVVTKNFYIFTKSPLTFKPLPFLLGRKGPAQCIGFDATGQSEFILIPRDASLPVQYVPVDPHFNFHYANAYEVPDTEDSSNISKVTAPTTTAAVEGAAAGTVAGGSGASGGGKAPDTATNIDTTAQGNHLQQDIQHRHHKIVIDTVRCAHMEFGEGQPGKPVWQDLDYAKLVPYSRLVRYTLCKAPSSSSAAAKSAASTKSGKPGTQESAGITGGGEGEKEGEWRCSSKEDLSDVQLDFPSVNPAVVGKPYRYVWASASLDPTQSAPVQGLIKIDLQMQHQQQRWDPQTHEFLGEVVFAPKHRPHHHAAAAGANTAAAVVDEDEGYLVSLLWDGRQRLSYFVVFDAQNIAQGPISKLLLPVTVPFGLHGTYVPDLVFRPEDITRKFNAFSAIDNKQWNEINGGFSGLGITQGDL